MDAVILLGFLYLVFRGLRRRFFAAKEFVSKGEVSRQELIKSNNDLSDVQAELVKLQNQLIEVMKNSSRTEQSNVPVKTESKANFMHLKTPVAVKRTVSQSHH
jgi:hypothetical protein